MLSVNEQTSEKVSTLCRKGSKVESNLLTHPAPITVLLIAKIVQMSAMKVYFQIAECSLSYAKLQNSATKCKQQHLFILS